MAYEKRPIVVVDGMNIFIRHYMANESMSSKSEPVGGVVGFLRFIDNVVDRWSPSKLIVVWENGGASPRRKALAKHYKANRVKGSKKGSFKSNLKDDLAVKVSQLGMLHKILQKTPVNQIFIENTECDDIIGYLIKNKFAQEDCMKLIMSGDKDFYQLLDDENVKMFDPARKITIDNTWVKEKYEISAKNFCLARTFVGDVSDNIEGVPGIGLKTLSKRFPLFQDEVHDATIDEVLTACKELSKTKAGAKLKAVKEILQAEKIVRRNWQLMYLGSSNLAAFQIQKVNHSIDDHAPIMDKLGFIKEIVHNGINMSFDYDRFSMGMKQNLIFD